MAVHAARVKGHAAVLAKASGRSACEERVEERVQAAVARPLGIPLCDSAGGGTFALLWDGCMVPL